MSLTVRIWCCAEKAPDCTQVEQNLGNGQPYWLLVSHPMELCEGKVQFCLQSVFVSPYLELLYELNFQSSDCNVGYLCLPPAVYVLSAPYSSLACIASVRQYCHSWYLLPS